MSERMKVTEVPRNNLSVSKMADTILLKKKENKSTDMVCDVCGLVCRRRVRQLPQYLSSAVTQDDETLFKDGAVYLQIIPITDHGINPPITECLKVASENVQRICKLFKRPDALKLERKVYPLVKALLFNAEHRLNYCRELSEFELAVAHVMLFCPSIMEQIRLAQSDEEKTALMVPELELVLEKHRRIREGHRDLNMLQREEAVKQLVYSLNETQTVPAHRQKVRETCDRFLFSKVIPFQKYADFSDQVIAGAIYCLGCTYAPTIEVNISSLSRLLGVLSAAVHSVQVRMGEDILAMEK